MKLFKFQQHGGRGILHKPLTPSELLKYHLPGGDYLLPHTVTIIIHNRCCYLKKKVLKRCGMTCVFTLYVVQPYYVCLLLFFCAWFSPRRKEKLLMLRRGFCCFWIEVFVVGILMLRQEHMDLKDFLGKMQSLWRFYFFGFLDQLISNVFL